MKGDILHEDRKIFCTKCMVQVDFYYLGDEVVMRAGCECYNVRLRKELEKEKLFLEKKENEYDPKPEFWKVCRVLYEEV